MTGSFNGRVNFLDDYDSLQSQSDAAKAENQAAPTAAGSESIGPVTSNASEGINLSAGDKKSIQVADDDEVLNLVKVEKLKESPKTEAGVDTKDEEADTKSEMKTSELSEVGGDVKKEHEKDDEDTLSESEAAVKVKPSEVNKTTVKDEAAMKKDDADDDVDHSEVPSPCPEVC